MSDVMFFGVLRMPYEMAMADDLSRYQFYTRAQEAADRVEKAERELAERAVSPAESVDTPELRGLLERWFLADDTLEAERMAHAAIIAHIDASRTAAHAEGRRSAMEELAKEKERADRAEAKIKADDETARLMFDDLRKARKEQAQRAYAAEKRLLSNIDETVNRFLGWKLPKTFSPDNGIAFYPPEHPEFWPIGTNLLTADQAKAMFEHCLLSSTAQPLQQEGGKVEAAETQGVDLDRLLNLIIEHGIRPADAYRSRQEVWSDIKNLVAPAASQPSDNLQQASKPNADCSGDPANCPDNEGYGCACAPLNKAASATDGLLKQFLKAAEDAGITHLNFKQATPEGGQDLPPLPSPCQSVYPSGWIRYTADQMRDYARAAIAATTAAEPVTEGWLIEQILLFRGNHNPADWAAAQRCARTIAAKYRAAQPQQVDTSANSDHRIMQVDDNGMPM